MEKYKPEGGKIVVVTEIPDCIFCELQGIPGIPGPYDFASKQGPWANGCKTHWEQHAARPVLGTGCGQLWITRDQVAA